VREGGLCNAQCAVQISVECRLDVIHRLFAAIRSGGAE
jgi:hypothetical protein